MSEWTGTLLSALLDASMRTLLIGAGIAIIMGVFRIRSASVRHGVWTSALCAMLLMPILPYAIPPIAIEFPIPIPASPVVTPVSPVPHTFPAVESPSVPVATTLHVAPSLPVRSVPAWPAVAAVCYAIGVVLLSVRMLLGWRLMRRLAAEGHRIDVPGFGRVYESRLVSTALTAGIVRTRILLPATWTSWTGEKLRAILTHEAAHVQRRDAFIGFLARLNCCLFWFHPLAWWLQKKLAIIAEHACDDAAMKTMATPRQYAEVLLEMAESVRRTGGRLSWQGIGVGGTGILGERIERVLRNDGTAGLSRIRKLIVVLNCAAVILFAVACRDQSPPAAPTGPAPETPRAAAQTGSDSDQLQKRVTDWRARARLSEEAQSMTPLQVEELESHLRNNPEDLGGRTKLLFYYVPDRLLVPAVRNKRVIGEQTLIAARRRHILWFIEHHPDVELAASPMLRIAPRAPAPLVDPIGYEQAKKLWLDHAGKPDVKVSVLSNAAYFFEVPDKAIAEAILLRAKRLQPDNSWTVRLGKLYLMALFGATDAMSATDGMSSSDLIYNVIIFSTSEAEARSPFAQEVREKLANSTDSALLDITGRAMMHGRELKLDFDRRVLARGYLERAVKLNPQSADARRELVRIRQAQRFAETRQALRNVPKESKYEAVSALPDAERFVFLREFAEYSYNEAASLEVLDRDAAGAARERSKRFAEDLLKLAPDLRGDEAYSGAVFSANLLLANLAARDGDSNGAVKHVRQASLVPPSEEMAYAAPNGSYSTLCNILIGYGERDTVIAFLEHFSEISVTSRQRLLGLLATFRK
jgi:beta-lactamase regulating signal transducer with metallopeptidase domain